jgi:hypothetical protein
VRLPDPQRSSAVLIGTGKYADARLPDLPVVSRTIGDLAAALTDPVYGVIPQAHCTVLEDQGDIRLIGRHLRLAANPTPRNCTTTQPPAVRTRTQTVGSAI